MANETLISGKVVLARVTTEKGGDNAMFESLIEDADRNTGGGRIKMVYGDGSFDTRLAFNLLRIKGIRSGIKVRKNASTRSKGSPYRAKCVREYREMGYERWRDEVGYGKRWRVESTFSAIKRMFGETVRASSMENMLREVEMKVMICNMLLNL